MGGKQKRAAKLKRWKESQSHLLQIQQSKESLGSEASEDSSPYCHHGGSDSGGCGDQLTENDLYKIRMEILRQRQRKGKNRHRLNFKWITTWFDRFSKAFDHWPKWPILILVSLLSFVGMFFLIRSLVQMFLPYDAVGALDRSGAYTGLKNALPGPIYKTIVLIDYLLTSATLSWDKMTFIMYPPEEAHQSNRKSQYSSW